MKINKIEVCTPIQTLVETLINNGFEVTDSNVSDSHFHEVFFRLKGENVNVIEDIYIDNIKKVDNRTFSYKCHWSIVEIGE